MNEIELFEDDMDDDIEAIKQRMESVRKKWFKKHKKHIVMIFAAIIICCAGVIIYNVKFKPKPNPEPVVIDFGFEKMGKLVTITYYFTEVANENDKGKKWWYWDNKKLIASYDGYIEAGIDFTKVEVTHNKDLTKYTITLPHAEIIGKPNIDEDTLVTYEEKGKYTNKEYDNIKKKLKKHALKVAKEKGILNMADEQAKDIVEKMVYDIEKTENIAVDVNFVD